MSSSSSSSSSKQRYPTAHGVPNDRTAYTSLLWGKKPQYMVEALISGCSLMNHCTKKRILFVDDVTLDSGFAALFRLFWDVRLFEHHDAGAHTKCTQERLSGVWSKMLPWKLLAKDIDVAFMLDTDILVRANCDSIFQQMTHCECKGVYRGIGEFSLTCPRQASTIKSAESYGRGGGIHGGAVFCKPSEDTFKAMDIALKLLYMDNAWAEHFFGLGSLVCIGRRAWANWMSATTSISTNSV